jgi:hypothetical protein
MLRKPTEYTVDDATGCWVWAKAINPNGYGRKQVGGKLALAHRWYYEQAHGPIPQGLTIDHLCRNRACVNPAHLEAVTNAVNVRRGKCGRLTPAAVTVIRSGAFTDAELAARFGVAKNTIQQARTGTTWK